jgi:ATP-dependent DNA helicase RecQ
MHEFAQRMAQDQAAGLRLLDDYFRLPAERFLDACFGARRSELARATGTASWQRIVDGLSKDQRRIVEADEGESMLVLAGPGSGKTRVVVHRCAWLLRVARVPARAILVLCFNRSAALELRRRLRDLVGDDARGVLIQTYHGMAARLAGRSPADALEQGANASEAFRAILQTAIDLLAGGRADPAKGTAADAGRDDPRDDVRDRLLAGFRHILVDEYQDIDETQYQLVSAIAGRTLRDEDRRLAVLAVGDDDQNIYQWRGSKLEFLRRFETDYRARRLPLVENYRSTAHIVAAANDVIAPNRERLKRDHALRVDGGRAAAPAGGRFAALDPDGGGRVRVVAIDAVDDQPAAVLAELRRLAALDAGFAFADCAVLAPRHALLDAVRAALAAAGVPVRRRVDGSQAYSLFRLREVQSFLTAVDAEAGDAIAGARLRELADGLRAARPRERHHDLVAQTLRQFLDEFGEHAQPAHAVREFFGDVLLEQRREQSIGDGVLLGTVHGSKGAEHDHVLLLDGGWQLRDHDDLDARRRLYYVGMTRARQTLTLLHCPGDGAPWLRTLQGPAIVRATGPRAAGAAPGLRYELLGNGDLWLAFAGRDEQHAAIAAAIDGLCSGDALQLVAARGRLCLATADGTLVGALSREAATRWLATLATVAEVRVAAILTRRRSDEAAEYREPLRRDRWHVVIPEITCRRAAAHHTP